MRENVAVALLCSSNHGNNAVDQASQLRVVGDAVRSYGRLQPLIKVAIGKASALIICCLHIAYGVQEVGVMDTLHLMPEMLDRRMGAGIKALGP